jgi:hypothetical protein
MTEKQLALILNVSFTISFIVFVLSLITTVWFCNPIVINIIKSTAILMAAILFIYWVLIYHPNKK